MAVADHVTVRVRLGHALYGPAGRPYVDLSVAPGTTAGGLIEHVAEALPRLGLLLQLALVVADGKVLGPGDLLPSNEEIALMLPIVGG